MKIILILAASIFLSGCLPSLGPSDAPAGPGEFREGTVTSDFPPIPLYEEAKVIESYSRGGAHGATAIAQVEMQKVLDFYVTGLDFYKWEYTQRQVSPTHVVFDIRNSQYEGNVYVNQTSDNSAVAITISVEQR